MTIAEVRERPAHRRAGDDGSHGERDVCVPLDELDGIVRDLYSVGMTLSRLGRIPEAGSAEEVGQARAALDRVITRVHMAAAGFVPGQFDDQPRTGGERDTIELLDAAHAVRRARLMLEEALSPPASASTTGSI